MEALLILAGMLLLLLGWVTLAGRSWTLGVSRWLLALLLPWLTLLVRRQGYPLWPRILLLLGTLSLASGLLALQQQQPARFAALTSLASPTAQQQQLPAGTLLGVDFQPHEARLEGRQLRLIERRGSREHKSLRILLDTVPLSSRQLHLQLLPGDSGPWPELLLQRHPGGFAEPQLMRIERDYSIDLHFQPQPDGQLRIQLHLQLPVVWSTRISGDIRLEQTPDWLQAVSLPALQTTTREAEALPEPVLAASAVRWEPIGVEQLLASPGRWEGRQARLVSESGRVHQGLLRGMTPERRILLELPQGGNQVMLQFFPMSLTRIEVVVDD